MSNAAKQSRTKHGLTLQEAEDLLPMVFQRTAKAKKRVDGLIARLEAILGTSEDLQNQLEREVNKEVDDWRRHMEHMGLAPKGLWQVDFPKAGGWYCWKFPEERIVFEHKLNEGYRQRRPIDGGDSAECDCELISVKKGDFVRVSRNSIFRSLGFEVVSGRVIVERKDGSGFSFQCEETGAVETCDYDDGEVRITKANA